MKKETHTFYNYQFKHAAVSVANHESIQVQHVAAALNIHPFMLSRWKKQMRDGILKDNDQEARSVTELNAAKKKIKELEFVINKPSSASKNYHIFKVDPRWSKREIVKAIKAIKR